MNKSKTTPGADLIDQALRQRKRGRGPRPKPLSEVAQLERQLYLANLALDKYEQRLEHGVELTPEEERLFLAHQDSLRKLETTLAALKAKADLSKKSDVDLAREMLAAGMEKEQVLALYENNESVRDALRDPTG